jgi:hypothetical protein
LETTGRELTSVLQQCVWLLFCYLEIEKGLALQYH